MCIRVYYLTFERSLELFRPVSNQTGFFYVNTDPAKHMGTVGICHMLLFPIPIYGQIMPTTLTFPALT